MMRIITKSQIENRLPEQKPHRKMLIVIPSAPILRILAVGFLLCLMSYFLKGKLTTSKRFSDLGYSLKLSIPSFLGVIPGL